MRPKIASVYNVTRYRDDPQDYSLQIALRGFPNAIAPGAPTGLSATANGTNQIDLSWGAPSNTGGEGVRISGYSIEVSTDGGTIWTDLVEDTGDANTSYSHTGLQGGATHHYRVSAINSAGTGDSSSVANATTVAVAPGAPTELTATPNGQRQIDLFLDRPCERRRVGDHGLQDRGLDRRRFQHARRRHGRSEHDLQ